jgi:GTP pyrophosphokinase
LEKDSYKAIARCLDERRVERDQYIEHVIQKVQQALNQHGLSNVNIKGRSKHIYSIYSKMKRKHIPFEEVYDVQALRIIVDTLPQCYLALGIIHNMWRPVPGEFDDYIASPKDNFYQSLHTAVIDDSGRHLEVQIRTWDMHEHAEYGIAAHWRYKEGAGRDDAFDNRVAFIRRLLEFGQEDDNQDSTNFMEALRTEVFEDRVYVFTPQGDIVDLPKGATPIDFAYHIHTEVGNRCRGAKVNGKLVTLSYELKNGDKVKIETNKYGGPKLDWLNSGTGFVKTQRARSKIRYWFRKQNRDKNLAEGRNVVVHELKRLGLSDTYTFESGRRSI